MSNNAGATGERSDVEKDEDEYYLAEETIDAEGEREERQRTLLALHSSLHTTYNDAVSPVSPQNVSQSPHAHHPRTQPHLIRSKIGNSFMQTPSSRQPPRRKTAHVGDHASKHAKAQQELDQSPSQLLRQQERDGNTMVGGTTEVEKQKELQKQEEEELQQPPERTLPPPAELRAQSLEPDSVPPTAAHTLGTPTVQSPLPEISRPSPTKETPNEPSLPHSTIPPPQPPPTPPAHPDAVPPHSDTEPTPEPDPEPEPEPVPAPSLTTDLDEAPTPDPDLDPAEIESLLTHATDLKMRANALYASTPAAALPLYFDAVSYLNSLPRTEPVQVLRATLHANAAACYIAASEWDRAVEQCDVAIEAGAGWKALARRAKAREEKGGWKGLEDALKDHLAILTTTPPPPPSILAASRASAARLPALIDAAREREQAEAMAKLKQVGDSFLGLFGMSTDNFKLTKNEGGGYSVGFQK